jgi:enediyne biosynthesis protein E4
MNVSKFRLLFLVSALALLACLFLFLSRQSTPSSPSASTQSELARLAEALESLEAREQAIAETVWSSELLAQRCGRLFEQLWDDLNATRDKWPVVASFPFRKLIPGRMDPVRRLPHDIELYEPASPDEPWTHAQWQTKVATLQQQGWQLDRAEFRHNQFDVDAQRRPSRSVFYFAAHLSNPSIDRRAALQGNLTVDWIPDSFHPGAELPSIERIDASQLVVTARSGPPPFQQVLTRTIEPPDRSFFIDPLILYDLDGDGLSEIILAASNTLIRRRSNGQFDVEQLSQHHPGLIFTAVIADFDRDGHPDFLCATFDGLILLRGSPQGTFDTPGELVWSANPRLKYGQVLTCGDIDNDSDLDVWLGQYKPPYERGQMPTPYHNANDGYPSSLLINDGHGRFTDATEPAGLAPKRHRRTYSASFVDLDHNGTLDLLVVSDFAGIDLYSNNGHGQFTDVTHAWLDQRHAFGMAHTFTDFNQDGHLDFLVMGMHCPTAQRLDHLGLLRPGHDNADAARPAMTFGNRLFLGHSKTGFHQSPFNDSIARSGWSWGSTAFDFDNDSWPDVYVTTGHETRQSVRDYEPEFWLHDIYLANSDDDLIKAAYFGAKFARTRGRGHSYGGYEKNRLYLNLQGRRFLEIGHLMGVATEQDSRNVAADDLDGDGRPDLLYTTFEVWPETRQTLQVFRNTLETSGNWIGFRLREHANHPSPVGARITLHHSTGLTSRQLVTGDSHRTQHAPSVLFGLGAIHKLDRVEIRWIDGRSHTVSQPEINRYHTILLPEP